MRLYKVLFRIRFLIRANLTMFKKSYQIQSPFQIKSRWSFEHHDAHFSSDECFLATDMLVVDQSVSVAAMLNLSLGTFCVIPPVISPQFLKLDTCVRHGVIKHHHNSERQPLQGPMTSHLQAISYTTHDQT